MNILVIGGTRYIGVHLVRELLSKGHRVTIATRGLASDPFGAEVDRLILERTDPESLSAVLHGKYFDVVYDSLAYSSNDVKYLLDVLQCGRYIQTSTLSVYQSFKNLLPESDFDPNRYPLTWCSSDDFPYDEVKRQAECALFQVYGNLPAVAVRFPYVIGQDDYTKRLYFYPEHIAQSKPLYIDNITSRMSFVQSNEAGQFLAWLSTSDFCGSINAASYRGASIQDILQHVENKTNIKAILSDEGDEAPYNGTPEYSLDLRKSEAIGFTFSELDTWLNDLLDTYIDMAMK